MTTLDQIHESIEARIAAAKREITALEAARAALLGGRADGGTPAVLPKRSESKPRPAGPRRPVEVLPAGKLEAMLREAESGLSAITISKRSNAGYGQVLELLRDLERAGQVRRSGTRRTSLWRLVTDEERIAERAAELEALSVAGSMTAA